MGYGVSKAEFHFPDGTKGTVKDDEWREWNILREVLDWCERRQHEIRVPPAPEAQPCP